jgi:hypothetical protein
MAQEKPDTDSTSQPSATLSLIFPFWILAKLNLVTASFDNVLALFVIVFAADLTITYPIVRKAPTRINTQTIPLKVE